MDTRKTSATTLSPARIVNIVVGAWLFISAFLWFHTASQFTNTWIVGGLCAIFAAIAMKVPEVRWANAALAVWLFISVFALPTVTATFWNNLIVAIVMFVAALIPNTVTRRTTAGVRRDTGMRTQRPVHV